MARQAIKNYLETNQILEIDEKILENYSPVLKEKIPCFVTLTINDELRGCIGFFQTNKSLYETVIEMAINAAFFDYRFFPIQKEESDQIKIEISLLTSPKELIYNDASDLLKKLESFKHGVIVKKDFYEATYLPQVWEKIPDKELFLSSLCLKAQLPADAWKKEKLEIKVYEVENFKE